MGFNDQKKASSPLLPIFGLVLGLAFAIFAYFLEPFVTEFLADQDVGFGAMSELTVSLIVGVVLWLLLFSISMFFVSLLVGRSQQEDDNLKFSKAAEERRKAMEREKRLRKAGRGKNTRR